MLPLLNNMSFEIFLQSKKFNITLQEDMKDNLFFVVLIDLIDII
jgi:hypothetical protein